MPSINYYEHLQTVAALQSKIQEPEEVSVQDAPEMDLGIMEVSCACCGVKTHTTFNYTLDYDASDFADVLCNQCLMEEQPELDQEVDQEVMDAHQGFRISNRDDLSPIEGVDIDFSSSEAEARAERKRERDE